MSQPRDDRQDDLFRPALLFSCSKEEIMTSKISVVVLGGVLAFSMASGAWAQGGGAGGAPGYPGVRGSGEPLTPAEHSD